MSEIRKKNVLFFDDAPFWMGKAIEKDTIDKIKADAIILLKAYNNAMNETLLIDSLSNIFRKLHIKQMFNIGLLQIIMRIQLILNRRYR